eukprot:328763-Rhodomonas_salina.1
MSALACKSGSRAMGKWVQDLFEELGNREAETLELLELGELAQDVALPQEAQDVLQLLGRHALVPQLLQLQRRLLHRHRRRLLQHLDQSLHPRLPTPHALQARAHRRAPHVLEDPGSVHGQHGARAPQRVADGLEGGGVGEHGGAEEVSQVRERVPQLVHVRVRRLQVRLRSQHTLDVRPRHRSAVLAWNGWERVPWAPSGAWPPRARARARSACLRPAAAPARPRPRFPAACCCRACSLPAAPARSPDRGAAAALPRRSPPSGGPAAPAPGRAVLFVKSRSETEADTDRDMGTDRDRRHRKTETETETERERERQRQKQTNTDMHRQTEERQTRTERQRTERGQTEDRQTGDRQTDDRHTDDRHTDDGQTDRGQTDRGQTDRGQADRQRTDKQTDSQPETQTHAHRKQRQKEELPSCAPPRAPTQSAAPTGTRTRHDENQAWQARAAAGNHAARGAQRERAPPPPPPTPSGAPPAPSAAPPAPCARSPCASPGRRCQPRSPRQPHPGAVTQRQCQRSRSEHAYAGGRVGPREYNQSTRARVSEKEREVDRNKDRQTRMTRQRQRQKHKDTETQRPGGRETEITTETSIPRQRQRHIETER